MKITGCTVHIATAEVDDGPILAQETVPVRADDTVESLHERIKMVERRLYPDVLARLVTGADAAPDKGRRATAGVGAESGLTTSEGGDMRVRVDRALLSVSDKAGVADLGRALHDMGVELVSSGGTAKALADAGLPVTLVADVTGVPAGDGC